MKAILCWLFGHLRGNSKAHGWSMFVDQTCSRCGVVERQYWGGSGPTQHRGWQ